MKREAFRFLKRAGRLPEPGTTGVVEGIPNPSHPSLQMVAYFMRRTTDGMIVMQVDDGRGKSGPNASRQHLSRIITKRVSIPGEEWDEDETVPAFFLDERPAGRFAAIDNVPVPVADDRIRDAMRAHIAAREVRRQRSKTEIDARLKEVERQMAMAKNAEGVAKAASGNKKTTAKKAAKGGSDGES